MAELIYIYNNEPSVFIKGSEKDCRTEMNLRVDFWRQNGYKIEKVNDSHFIGFNIFASSPESYKEEIYINKVNGDTITNRKSTQLSTQKQTTMPTAKKNGAKTFKSVPYDSTKKDVNNRVIGNPYRLTSNGKLYQAVPERMVTLPKGNAFIIAKKHVQLDERNQATYVLGYSNLSGKRQNGKTRRHYFVARLIYRGGNPALALYRYSGYDLGTAKTVFSEIAYDSAEYLGKDNKFHSYRKKSMTSQEIVAAKVRQREALEKMKTAAYGPKEQRRAYAQANPKRFPRTAKK